MSQSLQRTITNPLQLQLDPQQLPQSFPAWFPVNCCCYLVSKLFQTLRPISCSPLQAPPCPWDFRARITEWVVISLPPGIFLAWDQNPILLCIVIFSPTGVTEGSLLLFTSCVTRENLKSTRHASLPVTSSLKYINTHSFLYCVSSHEREWTGPFCPRPGPPSLLAPSQATRHLLPCRLLSFTF